MLEHYKLLDKIGEGGYGAVYKAKDPVGRTVAVKILRNMNDDNVERFRSEMKILAQLKHEHIVKILDGKIEGKQNCIVMEYINAKSLDAILNDNGPFPPKKAAKILCQIAKAVHYAHEQGIIHRDIKPQNILYDIENDHSYLTDFGIAKNIEGDKKELTATGEIVGTLGYLSPEQVENKNLDARSDVFALGMNLYTLLVGHEVFRGLESYRKILEIASDRRVPLLSSSGKRFSPSLEGIFSQATRKDKEERYANAREFAEDLERFIAGEAPYGKLKEYTLQEYISMHKWAFGAGAAAVGALAMIIPITLYKNQVIQEELEKTNKYIESIEQIKKSTQEENQQLEESIELEQIAQKLRIRVVPEELQTFDDINRYFSTHFENIQENYKVNLTWAKMLNVNTQEVTNKEEFLKYRSKISEQLDISIKKEENLYLLSEAYRMYFDTMEFGMQWEKRLEFLKVLANQGREYKQLYEVMKINKGITENNRKTIKERYDAKVYNLAKEENDKMIYNEVLGLYYLYTHDIENSLKHFYRGLAVSPSAYQLNFFLAKAYEVNVQNTKLKFDKALVYSRVLEHLEMGLHRDKFYTQGYMDYVENFRLYLLETSSSKERQTAMENARKIYEQGELFLTSTESKKLEEKYSNIFRK